MTNTRARPGRADRLAHYLLRKVNRAVREHALIADGDRILVAVSGGKDSLTLLDLLYRRSRSVPERYTLAACMVRSGRSCGQSVPAEWLAAWCADRSVPFIVEDAEIPAAAGRLSACYLCARARRKALFLTAERIGCNKVALGHHADDRAETAIMGLFYSAEFRDMPPRLSLFGGRIVLIRPLAYVEEREIVPFARASGYPLGGEACPEGLLSKRSLVRRLLREAEADCRGIKRHILSALSRQAVPEGGEDAPADML